ncbi:MAG TPA: AraC family transcriptional regulator ligand-binding domain-containing protein [Kofleriaceae bacterium]|jgi:AraC-like DNA-binding protein
MPMDVVPVAALLLRLERLGIKAKRLATAAGIVGDAATTEQFFALWDELGVAAPADFGLRLATSTQTHEYDLASLAALHSPDVATALEKTARYKRLCGPKDLVIERAKSEATVFTVWRHARGRMPPRLVDASLASQIVVLQRGTGRPIVPKSLELTRPRSDELMLGRFFKCSIKFGARRDALVFDASVLALPFVTHNADLLRTLLPNLDAQIAPLEGDFLDEVRAVIARRMSGEKPSVDKVAHDLALSARTLQRRLGEHDVSYQALLDEVRHAHALRLLRAGSFEIPEVAFLLGFEELNSFTRAFRGWEGTTPIRWRARVARSDKSMARSDLGRRGRVATVAA